jgi:ornithine cyclodeaminase/alanine dehydrogenase-like protein (mu-crystallin family)
VFDRDAVLGAISPAEAIERVREGFVEYAGGDWEMPAKVYLDVPPDGDFRAMPAKGAGLAILKWVTSFPGNPARGLPVVMGVICVSSAVDGQPLALVDVRSVTALRTGAAAVLAAETLGRADASSAAVVGAGVNGRAVARTFHAVGRNVVLWDVEGARAEAAAAELGATVASSREEALGADVVATVTPGREIVLDEGVLQPGQHASLMGADGPGKAEIAVAELARVHVFCDDWEQAGTRGTPDPEARVRLYCDEWEQASKSGDLKAAVEQGVLAREDVAQLGDVLAEQAPGRQSDDDITIFDSTGLAIQDLAIALAAMERADELDLQRLSL